MFDSTQAENVSMATDQDAPTTTNTSYPAAGDRIPESAETAPSNAHISTPTDGTKTEVEKPKFPPVSRQFTSGSEKPYSAFPIQTKWFIVLLAGISAVLSPIR
jgi:hypothetical protein